jgi:hypothetical protein
MGQIGPFGFTTGLNTKASIYNMPKNSVYTCKNMRPWEGSLIEYNGTLQFNSSQINSGALGEAVIPNPLSAATYPFLVIVGGKIYGLSPSGTATDISGTGSFSLTGSGQYVPDILNGIMVIPDKNNVGHLASWNGTGNFATASYTSSPVFHVCNNFMFGFGANSSTLNWSNVADPTTWTSGNSLQFRGGDGDVIKALHHIGTTLYIFKAYSIGSLLTQTVSISGAVTLGPLTEVVVGIGCAGWGAVDKLPDGRLVFLGADGHAYIFDGSSILDISDTSLPSGNVQALFDSATPAVFGNYSTVRCYPPRKEVWFAVPNPVNTGDPNNRILIWNYVTGAWSDFEMSSDSHAEALAYIPTANPSSQLTSGGIYNSSGNMIALDGGYAFVHDVSGSGLTAKPCQWNASIVLNGEGRTFIPRSLILFHLGNSSTSGFTVTYGFDGGTLGNSKSIVTSTSYVRSVISLALPSTGQSNVGPSSIQIQVVDILGAGILFDPFYLSDELMI